MESLGMGSALSQLLTRALPGALLLIFPDAGVPRGTEIPQNKHTSNRILKA